MNRIREVFGVARVLLPVVHPVDRDTALTSVAVAHDAGVPGIFLIDQGLSEAELLPLIEQVRRRWPSLWVGLNLLSRAPAAALRYAHGGAHGGIDGLWSDNAAIEETASEQPAAQPFVDARRELGWNGLYFGGVAFKYQRPVPPERLGLAARTARPFVDVVCTSGPGTGQEAELAKVIALREGLGSDGALALASGVTDENIDRYLPYVDAYLVGTGLEQEFGKLDPRKVAELQRRISAFGR